MRLFPVLALSVVCGTLMTTACLNADGTMAPAAAATGPAMGQPVDIIATAVGPNMEEVTTLVTAVKAAGLVETLKGPGPFTVFAPTNAAFAKLPKGTVEELLKPENKEKLTKILTFHVVSGNNDAKAVMGMTSAKTVEGDSFKIMTKDGKVMLGNDKAWATVIKADIKCANGTIHWIDTVLMPE